MSMNEHISMGMNIGHGHGHEHEHENEREHKGISYEGISNKAHKRAIIYASCTHEMNLLMAIHVAI
jgi:hypothetical protein